jgi:hypothetical protein
MCDDGRPPLSGWVYLDSDPRVIVGCHTFDLTEIGSLSLRHISLTRSSQHKVRQKPGCLVPT